MDRDEVRLARLLMEGGAESITEAARVYRAEETACSGASAMYPSKGRLLLESRRPELEDLT